MRALRIPGCLLGVLACVAIGAATTSAQDAPPCDPTEPTKPNRDCVEPPTEPPDEPPPQQQPPDEPPARAPSSHEPQPPAPAARTVCPDGTWAPCPVPSQAESLDEDADADTDRRRDCRRRRRGVRRPKHCPRLRRQRGAGGREDGAERPRSRKERERRRAARERRRAQQRAREECEGVVSGRLVPIDRLVGCPEAGDLDALYIAGLAGSRPLPDPLPPGSRLDARFARLLQRAAASRWPDVLAVLRAQGRTGPAPAKAAELRALAKRLRGGALDERGQALADYHRAVGLAGLTHGMHAVKKELEGRVLGSPKVSLYGGGRHDVSSGRIDVRVLVTMLYLAERHGGITVTSLISGHGVFTKSGHVSLHSFGHAMDIAAIGGTPINGNQRPGGVAERALRSVMLLPSELRPSELISLFELGGPSFAMADHADHIHVGF